MSEEKLMSILNDLANGEMEVDEAFDEIAARGRIDFEPHYEGE